MKFVFVAVVSLLLLHLGNAAGVAPPQGVLLMLSDDIGSDSFQIYGSDRKPKVTANLDDMASKGFVGDHFYVNPLCAPSRGSIVSSRYPFRTGIKTNRNNDIETSDCLLAKGFKEKGYKTLQIGKWQISNGLFPERLVNRCGFDYYISLDWDNHRYKQRYHGAYVTNLADLTTETRLTFDFTNKTVLENKHNLIAKNGNVYNPKWMADLVVKFIQSMQPGEKFFIYDCMLLNHEPYHNPPQAYRGDTTFDSMLFYLDGIAGRFRTVLEDEGLSDKVMILFTSENGSPRGIDTPWKGRINNGAKGGLNDLGTRVPLFLYWPTVIPASVNSQNIADSTDILPTLFDAIGATIPNMIDGTSFWDQVISGSATSHSDRTYAVGQTDRGITLRDLEHRISNRQLFHMDDFFSPREIKLTGLNGLCSAHLLPYLNLFSELANRVVNKNGKSTQKVLLPMTSSRYYGCWGFACTASGTVVCVKQCDVRNCLECAAGDVNTCQTCSRWYDKAAGKCVVQASLPTTTTSPTTTVTTYLATTTTLTEPTTTSPPTPCNVEHCVQCLHKRPNRCKVCTSPYQPNKKGRKCLLP
eukprot:m.16638 g.16638  ORF g.16638 m.16638 type:complete len:582 (-) comp4652_c2_seq1:867-2612(-)